MSGYLEYKRDTDEFLEEGFFLQKPCSRDESGWQGVRSAETRATSAVDRANNAWLTQLFCTARSRAGGLKGTARRFSLHASQHAEIIPDKNESPMRGNVH